MPYLLVRLRVADYSNWKAIFDSHAGAQKRAGLRVTHIMRNADDPNEVVTLFEAETIAGAKGFVYSPEVPQSKQDSGVIDDPDIYFLD